MSSTDGAHPEAPIVTKYQPKPEESTAVDAVMARRKVRPPSPNLSISSKNGTTTIALDHPDNTIAWDLLANALGTTDYEFAGGLVEQLVEVGTKGRDYDGKGPNFMLSIIKGIAPRDEVEAMMAAQMAAVHMATMTYARRLAQVENIPQQDSAERTFNKLARTFAVQVEALKRYRTGGEQTVTVHHVTVNEGGQAIVGAVTGAPVGTGGSENREATP